MADVPIENDGNAPPRREGDRGNARVNHLRGGGAAHHAVAQLSVAADAIDEPFPSASDALAVKIEDRPLTDPFLPKVAWIAFGIFGAAMLGASMWITWLLWVNVQHTFPWYSTSLMCGYIGWVLWSRLRKSPKP